MSLILTFPRSTETQLKEMMLWYIFYTVLDFVLSSYRYWFAKQYTLLKRWISHYYDEMGSVEKAILTVNCAKSKPVKLFFLYILYWSVFFY